MIIKCIFRLLFCSFFLLPVFSQAQTRTIDLDAKNIRGPLNTSFKTSIGAGRANEGLRADWQQQLAELKRDARVGMTIPCLSKCHSHQSCSVLGVYLSLPMSL